jgi:peptidoglycan/LPS O-acetylase OafA/YrhL
MTLLPDSVSTHRSEIQGLRAVAIILVVLYHAGALFNSGFIGVDVFFVISGYVIAASLSRELRSSENISIAGFYARRVRRLLPALALMLGTVLFLSTWLSSISSRVQTVRTGFFATFSSSNLFLYRFRPDGYFVVSEKTNALLHTWSLSIEEQFYLVLPLLVALGVFIGMKRGINAVNLLKWCLAGVALLSFAACVYVSMQGFTNLPSFITRLLGTSEIDARFAFYLPVTRAWEFIAGVLVAWVGFRRISTRAATVVGFAGLALIVIAAIGFQNVQSFPGLAALLPVFGAVLVIHYAVPTNVVGKALTIPGLSWIGDRSYGWYLWHWPMIQFVKPFYPDNEFASLCAGLLAIVPAALSYSLVENRLRHGVQWRSKKMMGMIVVSSLAIPLIAGVSSRPLMPELDNHLDAQMGCEYGDLANLNPGGRCTIAVENSKGFTVLLGDSHAGMYSEAFVKASNELGLDAVISTNSNHPFLYRPWDEELTKSEYPYQALETLASLKPRPSVVVIGQSEYSMGTTNGESWSEMLIPILKRLDELDVAVVVLASAFSVGVEPRACSYLQVVINRCNASVDRVTNELEQSRLSRKIEERSAVGAVRNAVLMDTIEVLCPEASCTTYRDGKWWWRDNAHVSIAASQAMTPLMKLKMAEALKLQETRTD